MLDELVRESGGDLGVAKCEELEREGRGREKKERVLLLHRHTHLPASEHPLFSLTSP